MREETQLAAANIPSLNTSAATSCAGRRRGFIVIGVHEIWRTRVRDKEREATREDVRGNTESADSQGVGDAAATASQHSAHFGMQPRDMEPAWLHACRRVSLHSQAATAAAAAAGD